MEINVNAQKIAYVGGIIGNAENMSLNNLVLNGVDDYLNQIIKKHENTRAEKEMDRIRHVDVCNAQTGPIFLAYHHKDRIDRVVDQVKNTECVYDFISEDGIGHRCWVVSDQQQIDILQSAFNMLPAMYIADGHHRAASAVKVCMRRREAAGTYDGDEAFNSFLAVAFPDNQLKILPYYRVVKDLNGLTKESFLAGVQKYFEISEMGRERVSPREKLTYGCYLDHQWYLFKARPEIIHDDPVEGLDVSVLQDYILEPLLGIHDPKTDRRIDFVGGIRGIGELERRCHTDMCIAFSTCATEMSELFAVADANRLMPPKSTWFEPKLRSGLFIHQL